MFHSFANILVKIPALVFCLLVFNDSFSQTTPLSSEKNGFFSDTIKLPYKLISIKDTVFSSTDTTIIIREMIVQERKKLIQIKARTSYMGIEVMEMKDTIVAVSDTIVTKIDTVLTINEKVLQDIEAFSKKKNIISRALREILVFDKKEPPPPPPLQKVEPSTSIKPSAQPYEAFNEKIIRNIDIRVLDVFGPSISNPGRTPKSYLEKSANFIHIRSQRWLIRNKLLFESGERVNSLKISESERLLRQSNYIYDARISVVEIKGSDSVDVYVIAQDVWSINAGIGVGGKSFGGDFREVNFLGLGQQVESSATYDPKLPGGYNYSGKYTINNLYKTLITATLFYTYRDGQRIVGYGLNRDFLTPAIKFAGGFNMSFNKTPIYTLMGDSITKIEPLNYNVEDLWLGYAAKFNQHARSAKYKGNRMIFSGRVTRSDYLERPAIIDSSLKYNYIYYNTYFYLGSIGFINRRFYKDNYIFRFGRTEDVVEGYMLGFTSGIQKREIGSRPYYGVTAAWSKFNSKYGYIFGGAGIGGFYDANQWHEGVIYNKYLYFTPLVSLGNWRNRNFLGLRYSHGYNLIPGTTTNINRENGVRGFRSDRLIGDQKVVINTEINLFPPLNLVGFRMAFVGFADFAWVSTKGKLIDKQNFFPGYGVGIRFGNDHWIFGTFQFLVGYYPNANRVDKRSYQLDNSQKFFYNFNDFQFSRPEVIPF